MKNDSHHGGQQAYVDIKRTLVRGQRCLCGYCEFRLADGTSDAAIETGSVLQRVEHFHPKDDLARPPNWALHWPNLWAVCHGNSQVPPAGEPINPRHHLPPLRENLCCDAFKDRQIRTGQLAPQPEGWILGPDEVPAFPRLFQYAPDGTPEPCPTGCAAYVAPNNHAGDTASLVARTITHLNLGSTRLNRLRCIVKARLQKTIARLRETNPGANPRDVLLNLARRVFPTDPATPWPEFFTLLRWQLGPIAEQRLHEMGYAG